ncbi:lipopolysaccharide biosynthesis protein [Enterovirga aerilata]|uniref:Membrane protein involved in the export of O-antigen and teichoic acid n=1 Tax=Enterovirga aerilata TaxID=2730920 RepID=A0A849I9U7_9HYPH|nr:hypothetical protein [Enterovirga sp. DB1703]NNM74081.1 hypothetical protein [Enterovirga sp. DB1703]
MLSKAHLGRASWTLTDQAIVSVGAFVVNVTLARHLPPAEFGVYALLVGAMLLLQLVTGSLLFYPLSIRRNAREAQDGRALVRATFVLTLLFCAPLSLTLAAVLLWAGRGDLAAGVTFYFAAWQLQEMARRSLMAELAHRTALPGDALSYIGQAAVVISLGLAGELTLSRAFIGMGACAAAAGALQLAQAGALRRGPVRLGRTFREFVALGGWSLLNGSLLALRYPLLAWTLALLNGPAVAGELQAAANVVNMANPIILGLCNIIPQTAARAHPEGKARAWQAARPYALVGAPPILVIYALACIAPGPILAAIYGPGSPYVQLANAVQILAVASALNYGTDMICSYLHGVDLARTALLINGAGMVAALALVPLLAAEFGLIGACSALLVANLIRLLLSQVLLLRTIAHDDQARLA